MFEAQLAKSSIFKKVLESLKDLLNEGIFECTETGIVLQTMDNSHVSLVYLQMNCDGFDEYRCDKNISLGVNLSSMCKIMKCSSNDDKLTIKAEDEPDTVTFIFESQSLEKVSEYQMKLMDIDEERLAIPDMEYDSVVNLSSNEFSRICKDLSQFGEAVVISCSPGCVKFSAAGDHSANIKLNQTANVKKEEAVGVKVRHPVTETFATRYLNIFAKAAPLSPQVILSLSPKVPLVVEYTLNKLGHLRYYLAPKIEDEES